MPSWAKQEASAHLNSLMFFDPVAYLPYELVSIVFSHLSPSDLLNASGVNRAWREHTQDEELWRSIFAREGWHMDISKLRDFERKSRERMRRSAGGAPTSTSSRLQRRDSRKRRAGEAFSEGEASAHPADANGAPSADSSAEDSCNEHMDGVERAGDADAMGAVGKLKTGNGYARSTLRSRRSSTDSAMSTDSAFNLGKTDFKLGPTLLQQQGPMRDAARDPRVSWAYLYKQRRLLEKNWDDGKYEMFRLPHAQFPEEGHDECVYTIQHSGDELAQFQGLQPKLDAAERKLKDAQDQINKHRDNQREIVDRGEKLALKKGQQSLDYANSVEALRSMYVMLFEAEIMKIEARSDLDQLKLRHEAERAQLDEARAAVEEHARVTADLLREGQRLQQACMDTHAEDASERELEVLEEVKVMEPDELDTNIQSTEARLEMTTGGNAGIIAEYEDRAKKIERDRARLTDLVDTLQMLQSQIEEIKGQWEPRLDALVGQISEAFAENFAKIQCAGEVGVHKDEDFEQWAIQIRVKFR